MSDFAAIGSALYTALGGTAATPPVYYGLAAQGGTPPYVLFSRQTALDEYSFGTATGVSADYLIKAVSNRQWPAQAQAVYSSAHASVQDNLGSVSGYKTLRCRRMTTVEYRDSEGFWHVGGVYRVEITT